MSNTRRGSLEGRGKQAWISTLKRVLYESYECKYEESGEEGVILFLFFCLVVYKVSSCEVLAISVWLEVG